MSSLNFYDIPKKVSVTVNAQRLEIEKISLAASLSCVNFSAQLVVTETESASGKEIFVNARPDANVSLLPHKYEQNR